MKPLWKIYRSFLLLTILALSSATLAGDGTPISAGTEATAATWEWREARAMFLLGAHHIASGWDHLAFLLGLMLFGLTSLQLVKVVTAFTVAHSTTLALAALGYFAPSSDVIEPLIALTVAYVGLANLLWRKNSHSIPLVFGFGLIHGFGFAGALAASLSPEAREPGNWLLSLASFNLGIEAFQLLLIALVAPLLHWLLRYTWSIYFRRTVALAILGAGLAWFVLRLG